MITLLKKQPSAPLKACKVGAFQTLTLEGTEYVVLLTAPVQDCDFRLYYSDIKLNYVSVYEIHQSKGVRMGLLFHLASVLVDMSDNHLLVKMPLLAEYSADDLMEMGAIVHHSLPDFQAFHLTLGATLLALPDESLAQRISNAAI